MVKAIVSGAGGKMGGRVISLISATEGIQVAGGVERQGHPLIGRDLGESLGLGKTGFNITDDLEMCIRDGDVVIDFTHHESSLRHLEIAVKHKAPIVIGTTGFTADEMKRSGNWRPTPAVCLHPT